MRLLPFLLLTACGADVSAFEDAVPTFKTTLPEAKFIERFGAPCRIEPAGTGERWVYCLRTCPCENEAWEGRIMQCLPGCFERSAISWGGAVTWGP